MQLWYSLFSRSLALMCMLSLVMPCGSSYFWCSISWIHKGSSYRYIGNSSISSCKCFSPSNLVHDSMASPTYWKGWSNSRYNCYRCGLWNYFFPITSQEGDKFLTTVKHFSSSEEEIPTATRSWKSSYSYKNVLYSIGSWTFLNASLLVGNPSLKHRLMYKGFL